MLISKLSILIFLILFVVLPLEAQDIGRLLQKSDQIPSSNSDSTNNEGWFSSDKGFHFLGSFMTTVAGAKSFERFSNWESKPSIIVAASVSFSIGLGKEIYDSSRPDNKFSYKDILANVAGILVGIGVLQIE